jgi:hypothetical protein
MNRWQVALRCAAYLVVLVLGVHWLSAAAVSLQPPPIDSDARPIVDDIAMALRAMLGLKHQATLWLTALVLCVKPVVGIYLLLVVTIAVCAWIVDRNVDLARLDAALLLCVIAIMTTATPWLIALRMMPGAIDELTVAAIGIALSALSRPEFVAVSPAVSPPRRRGREHL